MNRSLLFLTGFSELLRSKSSEDFSEKIFAKLKKKKDKVPLNLSFSDSVAIICKICCKSKRKTKKLQTYVKGQKKIKEYFDFINIIFHMEEFEIMKKIMFNSNQRLMIDPNITPNLNDHRTEMKNKIKNMTISSINQHVKEFLSRCSENITEVDQNLLDYLLNE